MNVEKIGLNYGLDCDDRIMKCLCWTETLLGMVKFLHRRWSYQMRRCPGGTPTSSADPDLLIRPKWNLHNGM